MLDNDLILMVCYSKLVAIDEYLLKRGNEQVCTILDGVIDGLQTVLRNLEQKQIMENHEVVIVLPNGTEIQCTAKSAKYLIIGLGLESVLKDGKVEKSADK